METRYTLGMGHPNALHCMLWLVVVLAVYCYADRLKWYSYAAFLGWILCCTHLQHPKQALLYGLFFVVAAFAMR